MLDVALLQRLRGLQLQVRRAEASSGVGERRSRKIGPGLEFAEYRDYYPGDDVRYVDRHVFARHGRSVVRQFVVDQQLRITVLLDCSSSMRVGDASKFRQARMLTAAIAAVGVFGGDQVRLGAFSGKRVVWYPHLRSPRRLRSALAWLEGLRAGGTADLPAVAAASLDLVATRDLLVIVSDWMLQGIDDALRRFAAAQLEVVGVQVVAPDELDPVSLIQGPARFLDAESGEAIDITLDAKAAQSYRAAFRNWQSELSETVTRNGGRWLPTTSDRDVEDVILREWRKGSFVS